MQEAFARGGSHVHGRCGGIDEFSRALDELHVAVQHFVQRDRDRAAVTRREFVESDALDEVGARIDHGDPHMVRLVDRQG